MADDTTNSADNAEAQAAGEVNEDNAQVSSRDAKTVDNTEAPEAGKSNENSAKDDDKPADDKPAEPGTDDKSNDDKPAEPDTDDTEGDELDADELEALDAKVRRRVSKVQRENVNLRGRLKDAEGARDKVQRENERLTVAIKAGLDGSLLKFLTGDTVEELEENAADLLEVIGYNGRVTPSSGPIERGANPRRGGIDPASAAANETNLDTIGARIYKR